MIGQKQSTILTCAAADIAAYIDGELDPAREIELEDHFALCETCSRDLNRQKQFLCSLNASLKHEGEIDLPANFTKRIVANAESAVSGLRRPRERFNAVFICAGLVLFVLFASGVNASMFFEGLSGVFDRTAAVGGIFGRLFYSVFLGVAIIVRSVAAQFRVDFLFAVVLTVILAATIMYMSRRALGLRRA